MTSVKFLMIAISSIGLLFLGACSGGGQATKANGETKTAEVAATNQPESASKEIHKAGDGHDHKGDDHGKGGQVVETGGYHLEFLTHKADSGVSLDFMIGKGEAHTPVTDAKVTAQVQLPDGTQQALDMKYDAGEKAYKASLPKVVAGEYNIAVLSEIEGKKLNSRFSFKQ